MLQAILYLQTFLSTLMYSVVMPSVPLYMDVVNNPHSSSSSSELSITDGCIAGGEGGEGSSSSIYIGMAVGVYPLMAAVASPLLGWWYQRAKLLFPLLFSLLCVMLGNALYVVARLVKKSPSTRAFVVIGARAIIGVGATNGGLARTHFATVTPAVDKDKVMVIVTAFETFGLLLGPVLSGLVADVEFSIGPVLIDQFSLPSLIAMVLAMLSAAGFVIYEKGLIEKREREANKKNSKVEEHKRPRGSRSPSIGEKISEYGDAPRGRDSSEVFLREDDFVTALVSTVNGRKKGPRGLHVMLSLSFIVSSTWAAFETVMIPSTCRMYQWAVRENSFLLGGSACVCALVFVAYLLLRKRYLSIQRYQRHLYSTALLLLALGDGLLINLYPLGSSLPMFVLLFSALGPLAIGFALSQALGYSLYMLLVSSGTEGVAVGRQTSVNFLARFIGPVVSSALADILLLGDPLKYGSVTWIFNVVLLSMALALVLTFWADLWYQALPQEERHAEARCIERISSGATLVGSIFDQPDIGSRKDSADLIETANGYESVFSSPTSSFLPFSQPLTSPIALQGHKKL